MKDWGNADVLINYMRVVLSYTTHSGRENTLLRLVLGPCWAKLLLQMYQQLSTNWASEPSGSKEEFWNETVSGIQIICFHHYQAFALSKEDNNGR